MHFPFCWLNHKNFEIKCALLEQFYVGRPRENFRSKHVSEEKTCGKDSCLSVEIVFTLRSEK